MADGPTFKIEVNARAFSADLLNEAMEAALERRCRLEEVLGEFVSRGIADWGVSRADTVRISDLDCRSREHLEELARRTGMTLAETVQDLILKEAGLEDGLQGLWSRAEAVWGDALDPSLDRTRDQSGDDRGEGPSNPAR